MPPRTKALRWILSLLLAAAALGICTGSLFWRAWRTLETHREETRLLLETFPAETTERPAILDPAEGGNAWDALRTAFDTFYGTLDNAFDPPSQHRLPLFGVRFTAPGEEEDLSLQAETLEQSFELIRSVLRRRTVLPPKRPGYQTNGAAISVATLLRHAATLQHRRGHDLAAFERLIASIAQAQDVARHGDSEAWAMLLDAEAQGTLLARDFLESHSLSSADLKTVAAWLDRLSAGRPPLSRTMTVDNALERRFAADPEFVGAIYVSDVLTSTTPTWRELWSSLIHSAKRATSLARAAKAIEGVDKLPTWEREAAARQRLDALDFPATQLWELPNPDLCRWDARTLTYRALLRRSVAVAWYESEKGNYPSDVRSLVPTYLPSLDPCPATGKPFIHENGRVRFQFNVSERDAEADETGFSEKNATWTIARKAR